MKPSGKLLNLETGKTVPRRLWPEWYMPNRTPILEDLAEHEERQAYWQYLLVFLDLPIEERIEIVGRKKHP